MPPDRKQIRTWVEQGDDRAIAPEIGSVFLVVIVVILAVIGAGMALQMTQDLPEPVPVASLEGNLSASPGSGPASHNLSLSVGSGQAIAVDRLSVEIESTNQELPIAPGSIPPDGTINSNEQVNVTLPTNAVCSNGDQVNIAVTYNTGERSYVFSEKTYAVEGGQFTIQGGTVVPQVNYTASVELVGTAMTYGAGGANVPITASVGIGSDSKNPWPGNVNDGGNPRSASYDGNASEGISVTMSATGGATVDSSSGSAAVRVLRDGASPPSLDGLGNQANVESFVQPYVDNGTITLDDNQAIYLFELSGSTNTNLNYVDYQDAVVVVSLTASNQAVVDRTSEAENVIYCPD